MPKSVMSPATTPAPRISNRREALCWLSNCPPYSTRYPAGIGTACAMAARVSSITLPRSRPATFAEMTIRRWTLGHGRIRASREKCNAQGEHDPDNVWHRNSLGLSNDDGAVQHVHPAGESDISRLGRRKVNHYGLIQRERSFDVQ
jgi:hypothetical protein